jgi:hypothetical protein
MGIFGALSAHSNYAERAKTGVLGNRPRYRRYLAGKDWGEWTMALDPTVSLH